MLVSCIYISKEKWTCLLALRLGSSLTCIAASVSSDLLLSVCEAATQKKIFRIWTWVWRTGGVDSVWFKGTPYIIVGCRDLLWELGLRPLGSGIWNGGHVERDFGRKNRRYYGKVINNVGKSGVKCVNGYRSGFC